LRSFQSGLARVGESIIWHGTPFSSRYLFTV